MARSLSKFHGGLELDASPLNPFGPLFKIRLEMIVSFG
jgi:hypothetical protein